jgi:hypothetical protein
MRIPPFNGLLNMEGLIMCGNAIRLAFPLNGFEAYSFTLKEEPGLRVSGNRALRRIFGAVREEVTETRRKLHNDEFHNLLPSPNFIMVIKSRRDEKGM